MKSSIALFALLIALTATGAFAGETLYEIDASGGKAKECRVVFVSKPVSAGAPAGTAAVAAYKGDTFEGAFGMNIQAGKPVASAVGEETIKSERASDKEPLATTIVATVTEQQYAEVKKLIDEWSAIKEHEDAPNNVTGNFVTPVVDALGMKRAYRSGLQPLDPVLYFKDLAVLNRKMGHENS